MFQMDRGRHDKFAKVTSLGNVKLPRISSVFVLIIFIKSEQPFRRLYSILV